MSIDYIPHSNVVDQRGNQPINNQFMRYLTNLFLECSATNLRLCLTATIDSSDTAIQRLPMDKKFTKSWLIISTIWMKVKKSILQNKASALRNKSYKKVSLTALNLLSNNLREKINYRLMKVTKGSRQYSKMRKVSNCSTSRDTSYPIKSWSPRTQSSPNSVWRLKELFQSAALKNFLKMKRTFRSRLFKNTTPTLWMFQLIRSLSIGVGTPNRSWSQHRDRPIMDSRIFMRISSFMKKVCLVTFNSWSKRHSKVALRLRIPASCQILCPGRNQLKLNQINFPSELKKLGCCTSSWLIICNI